MESEDGLQLFAAFHEYVHDGFPQLGHPSANYILQILSTIFHNKQDRSSALALKRSRSVLNNRGGQAS
jgi:hypothetical protein